MQSGAREIEAEQFAAHIANIVANWSVQDNGVTRRAEYRDIMVLVRKRLHLRVYEHALRARHIPFLTSRRGGLLDTLEARRHPGAADFPDHAVRRSGTGAGAALAGLFLQR